MTDSNFSLYCNGWSWGWRAGRGTFQKPGMGQGVVLPEETAVGTTCVWRGSPCPQLEWTFCSPHPPAKQNRPSRQTQAVTSPSLLHTWHLRDPPSPAQGLCLLTPCVNLPSHPDPAEGSGGAPSIPQREKSGFSAQWRPLPPRPPESAKPLRHPLGYQSPWEFTQEFMSARLSSV